MGVSILPREPSYIKEAMTGMSKGAVSGYQTGMDERYRQQQATTQREQFQQKQVLDVSEFDYQKKRDIGNFMNDAVKQMTKEKADEFLADPQVKKVYSVLGWPLPVGVHKEDELTTDDFKKDILARHRADPNSVSEEEKQFAGLRVAPKTIPYAEVERARKDIPWWDKVIAGKQPAQKNYMNLRAAYEKQRGIGSYNLGGGSDPLSAR